MKKCYCPFSVNSLFGFKFGEEGTGMGQSGPSNCVLVLKKVSFN